MAFEWRDFVDVARFVRAHEENLVAALQDADYVFRSLAPPR
jgi:hypothetical protein